MKKNDIKILFIPVIVVSIIFGLYGGIRFSTGNNIMPTTECVGVSIPTEPCEYTNSNFSYKGDCSEIHEMLNIQGMRTDFDKYKEDWFNDQKEEFCSDYLIDMGKLVNSSTFDCNCKIRG